MRKYLAAAMLCMASATATADTTFEFDVTGSVTFISNGFGNGYTYPIYSTEPFSGIASLVVSGNGADGIYSFSPFYAPMNSLVSFDISTPIGVGINTQYLASGSLNAYVQNGAVTSVSGSAVEAGAGSVCGDYGTACYTFGGLDFSETMYSGPEGYGAFMAGGVLTPIPEPPTWAMMSLGLVGLAFRNKRRNG